MFKHSKCCICVGDDRIPEMYSEILMFVTQVMIFLHAVTYLLAKNKGHEGNVTNSIAFCTKLQKDLLKPLTF